MKNKSSGWTDSRLRQRVEQYLASKDSEYVDLSEMALNLQRLYRVDYGRRNKTAFRIQVEKVYEAVKEASELSNIEKKHLAKRARSIQREGECGSSSTDSTDQDDGFRENTLNSTLTSLYKPGISIPSSPSSRGAGIQNSGMQVSSGGWFIDKGPGPTSSNTLIDLCEDEPVDGHTEVASSRENRILKKSRKRKKSSADPTETQPQNNKAKWKPLELQYPCVTFEDVGGNEEALTEVCKLLIYMHHPEVFQQLGVVPPRGFLLHGPPGCGKTLLAQAVAGELQLPLLKVSAPELVSGVSGESEQKLRELFDQAVSSSPCILFIDEIDAITPKREVASKDMERRMVAQLLTCMDDLNSLPVTVQVMIIGATNRPDSLDPALRRAGRFDREISLGIPDEAARLRILETLCRKLTLPADFDFLKLARLTPGYVGADLMALCREAAMNAVNRILMAVGTPAEDQGSSEKKLERSCPAVAKSKQLQAALSSVQPSAKREGFATVPDVSWEHVGALQDVREELTMAILAPVRSPELFRALGLGAPSGVLLAGPPGCGKTLLAKAVANESGLNFISVKGPELLNMYVGESERAVRQVFQRGRNSAPCVIFFDEIDALCPRRSGHESGASIRVVNQLLTEMDGLETRRQVFIMAATNRPDIIDPAVLRPGRLDKTLYVGLPGPADRCAILLAITKGGTRPQLGPDVHLEEIASDERCSSFSGADLTALVREASVNALKDYLKSQQGGEALPSGCTVDIQVSRVHFEEALNKVRPSVSPKEQLRYEQLRDSLQR